MSAGSSDSVSPAPGRVPAPAGAVDPARIVVRDDGGRSRLTVFFRLLLSLPHLVLLAFWTPLAFLLAIFSWFTILVTGRPVATDMQARFVRYFSHVLAYLTLAAEPFPAFGGGEGYPVDLELSPPARQNRWKTLFRVVLAVPAILLGSVFGSFQAQAGTGGRRSNRSSAAFSAGIIGVAAVLAWFATMALGRTPRGLRDLTAYGIGYLAQLWSYLLLVTDRYPNSDPLYVGYPDGEIQHPVRIEVDDDLRRSRLTVFFRLLLWLPHLVWLLLWGFVVAFAVFFNWFVTLFAGRPAGALHRFTARYLRYYLHTATFLYLVANPFPGFVGRRGTYPVDLELPEPERQNRWKTGFRLVLVIPALFVSGALNSALTLVALFGWFTGLFLGRVPEGLRNLGVLALRYQAQVSAYLALLTDRYPFASPALEAQRAAPSPVPE